MSKKLVWVLAGGAVLVLGGAAIWLWRRRSKSAAKPSKQPPAPEPDETPSPESETIKATRAYLAHDQFGLFTPTPTA